MKRILVPVLLLIVGIICFELNTNPVLAYIIEDLDLPAEGDFIVGPGKTELWMDSGGKHTKELLITNRTGDIRLFKIDIEDFRGSREPDKPIQFLGPEEKGPYSLKDYLNPEIREFTLSHGQRMRLPVEISIPEDAEPGGLYGSILVAASVPGELGEGGEKEIAGGQMKIITRLASLFFIRVKGDALEEGFLKDFGTPENLYEKGPVSLNLIYENNGNVHLTPYGKIEIKNFIGRKIEEIEVDPWFVMPDSVRAREIKWEGGKFLFGRYTVNLSLNRGYQDIIDQKSFAFWIIPWKILLIGFLGLVIVIWFVVWVAGHFEIRRKKEEKEISP